MTTDFSKCVKQAVIQWYCWRCKLERISVYIHIYLSVHACICLTKSIRMKYICQWKWDLWSHKENYEARSLEMYKVTLLNLICWMRLEALFMYYHGLFYSQCRHQQPLQSPARHLMEGTLMLRASLVSVILTYICSYWDFSTSAHILRYTHSRENETHTYMYAHMRKHSHSKKKERKTNKNKKTCLHIYASMQNC